MENLSLFAALTIISGALSVLCLLLLHFLSPEFHPGWRMVSEYALGRHKLVLTLFFVFWFLSSVFSGILLWSIVTTAWAKFGVILIFVSGAGALMGGLFDIKHKLHGFSSILGIPTLPAAALLISYHLVQQAGWSNFKSLILISAHSTWISLVLFPVTMVLIFSGFKKAGLPLDKDAEPPKTLPAGVIGINGYANRLLIICYIGWLILMAAVTL